MFGRHWQKTLSMLLWISPHVLLAALALVFYTRRLYRQFPVFFAYVLYEIAEFLLLLVLYFVPRVTAMQYGYVFCFTLFFSIALRFGIIGEISRNLWEESVLLKKVAGRTLLCLNALLLVTCAVISCYVPVGNSIQLTASISVVNRAAAMVQCGLLLCLLLFSRFLGLNWRRMVFGIVLGLSILTSVDVATYALRPYSATETWKEFFNLLTTGSYLICVLIWLGYTLAPESNPVPEIVVSHDEVEVWNQQLQHLLRH
jgi:hypothetical protein